jgi:hypothetical protein
MDTSNQNRSGSPEPSRPLVGQPGDAPATGEVLAELAEEIEELVDLDPAAAADRAVDVADRLGRQLEEDER